MSREGWFAPSLLPPPSVQDEIASWAAAQTWPEGTKLTPARKLHTTLFYAPEAYGTPQGDLFMDEAAPMGWGFEAWTSTVEAFSPSLSGDHSAGVWTPVVLELHSFWLKERMREVIFPLAEAEGIEYNKYESEFRAHITVAKLPPGEKLEWRMPPHIHFHFVPILQELHEVYDGLKSQT